MSMSVRISINGETLDIIHITNRGPIDGEYAPEDHPGGDGERLYTWSSLNKGDGTVIHRRGEGAHALAAAVMNEIAHHDRPVARIEEVT